MCQALLWVKNERPTRKIDIKCHKVANDRRWSSTRKGCPEEEALGWGWKDAARRAADGAESREAECRKAVLKARCGVGFFCSETGARDASKLFLQNKIASQIKRLLKRKRTPRNLETRIFFLAFATF